MGWLSGLKSRKLVTTWEFTVNGIIWRLLPSQSGVFVGEERNKETKQVSFFCIDQHSGRILWKDIHFDEQWWIGIETLHDNILFLHEFATPDMPDHKKIYTVDISTGKMLWMNHELKFLFATNGNVYAARDSFDDRLFYQLNATSGEILAKLDASSVNILRETASVSSISDQVQYPVLFEPSHGNVASVSRLVEKGITGAKQPQLIEYLDIHGSFILSYYDRIAKESTEQAFQHQIIIMDRNTQSVLSRDIANARTVMPVPDTLFGIGSYLYYIKEARTLRAIDLSTSGV
jgi:hypothetical protein